MAEASRSKIDLAIKTINGAQYERVGGGWAPVFASSKLWSSADEKRQRRKSSDKLPAVPGALPPLAQRDAAAAAARDEPRSSSAKSKRLPALGAGLPQMHPPRRSSAPVGAGPGGFGGAVRLRAR